MKGAMKMIADIESTVRQRKSIRSYEPRPLTEEDKDKVRSLITEILSDRVQIRKNSEHTA